jgi:hypothetical protein
MSQIIVKSVTDGFRRAGIAFNREGVVLNVKDLTEAQLEAIKGESMLIVSDYTDPAAKAGGKGGKEPQK